MTHPALARFAALTVGLLLLGSAHAEPKFKVMHAAELSQLIESKAPGLAVYDANLPDFRAKEGLIPGAKPLSSFNRYDVAKELPAAKDAKLVFYCANTH